MEHNGKLKVKLNLLLLPSESTVGTVKGIVNGKMPKLSVLIGQLNTQLNSELFFDNSKQLLNLEEEIKYYPPFNCSYVGNGIGKIVLKPEKGKKTNNYVKSLMSDDCFQFLYENLRTGSLYQDDLDYCGLEFLNRFIDPQMVLAKNVSPKYAKKIISEIKTLKEIRFDRAQLELDSKYIIS